MGAPVANTPRSEALEVVHESASWCEDVAPPGVGPGTQDTLAATAGTGVGRVAGHDETPTIADGTEVGRYIVVGQLGAGGMGIVYIAFDPELERDVALKLLHRETRPGTRARERLVREAQALARLSHPNVVRVYDVGEHEGQVFLAMEFVQGHTLRKWLEAAPRTWPEILDVLVRAGRGLAAAHTKEIVHRDFKPDNVMVADDGRVLVMDFGLARSGDVASIPSYDSHQPTAGSTSGTVALTNAGAALGTPAYMAPEQHLRQPTDPRTDQFSFCVTLYEALYGTRPFGGDSLAALSLAITEGRLRDAPRGHRVPARVYRAVERGLSRTAEARWPTLDELLGELQRDPRPARRRWATVGMLAGAVGTYAGWQSWSTAQAAAACDAEGNAITEVWNSDRRAAITAVVRDADVDYATDSWLRAAKRIDHQTEAWSRLRTRACRAALVDHTRSLPELDRSRECFDERRTHIDALLTKFEEGGSPIMQRMVTVVVQLADMQQCVDETWLSRRPPASSDVELRSQLAALRNRLVEIGVWVSTGHYQDALIGAETVRAEAEALDSMVLIADARLAAGIALERSGEFERAQQELELAYYTAGGIGHDAAALRAATRLSFVTGYQLAKPDDGLRWASAAQMLVTRLGLVDEPAVALWLTNLGSIHQASGKYDEALDAQQRALEVARRTYGETHPQVAVQWANLANAHHGQGAFDEAIAAHRHGLEIREATLGPSHPDVAISLINLGATQLTVSDYHRAQVSLARALAIQTAAFGEQHPLVARILNNLGAAYYSGGEWEQAREVWTRALTIQMETLGANHPDLASPYSNIGRVHDALGDYDQALASFEQALELRIDALGPQHPHVARVHNNIGRTHRELRSYDLAVAAHERALKIWIEAQGPNHPRVGSVLYDLGITLTDAGDSAQAITVLSRALAIREATQASLKKLGRTRFALARASLAAGGDASRARRLAHDARAELLGADSDTGEELYSIDVWLHEVGTAG